MVMYRGKMISVIPETLIICSGNRADGGGILLADEGENCNGLRVQSGF